MWKRLQLWWEFSVRYRWETRRERFWRFMARLMPKALVYHCTIRCAVKATTGEYGDQIVPELTIDKMLKRW